MRHHMLPISTAMHIQEVIYLLIPTLPTDTSDSDASMVEEAETHSLKRLVLLPEGTICVKHRGNGFILFGCVAVKKPKPGLDSHGDY